MLSGYVFLNFDWQTCCANQFFIAWRCFIWQYFGISMWNLHTTNKLVLFLVFLWLISFQFIERESGKLSFRVDSLWMSCINLVLIYMASGSRPRLPLTIVFWLCRTVSGVKMKREYKEFIEENKWEHFKNLFGWCPHFVIQFCSFQKIWLNNAFHFFNYISYWWTTLYIIQAKQLVHSLRVLNLLSWILFNL